MKIVTANLSCKFSTKILNENLISFVVQTGQDQIKNYLIGFFIILTPSVQWINSSSCLTDRNVKCSPRPVKVSKVRTFF